MFGEPADGARVVDRSAFLCLRQSHHSLEVLGVTALDRDSILEDVLECLLSTGLSTDGPRFCHSLLLQ